MKTKVLFPALGAARCLHAARSSRAAAALAAAFCVSSCLVPVPADVDPAVLRLELSGAASGSSAFAPSASATRATVAPFTKATVDPFDTDAYILTLTSSDGKTAFRGLWGERPHEFELAPGTYAISMLSSTFKDPSFDSPQFGDTRSVTLSEGQEADVELSVSQLNSGLRLKLDEKFVATYKDAALFLRSVAGTLAFGFGETRTAFFQPGRVVILLNNQGKTATVHSLELRPGEIMTLRLGVAENMPKAMSVTGMDVTVKVDTVRLWSFAELDWDGSSSGIDPVPSVPDAVSVNEARGMAGSKDLWVCGYIVGGDLSSRSCSFEGPFSSRTNLVIADVPGCTDRGRCMSVQLSVGDIRNALNLVDTPSLLGRQVWLRGDVVEAYYGIPGLQNLSDYRL